MPATRIADRHLLGRAQTMLNVWQDICVAQERPFLISVNDFVITGSLAVELPGLRPACGDQFIRLLELGAGECAVLRLLTDDSGYMISRGSDGISIATVVLAGWEVEATAQAHTGGLALAGAILLSLTQNGVPEEGMPQPLISASTAH